MPLNIGNISGIELLASSSELVAIEKSLPIVCRVHCTMVILSLSKLFIKPHSVIAEVCLTSEAFRPPTNRAFVRYASCHWGYAF